MFTSAGFIALAWGVDVRSTVLLLAQDRIRRQELRQIDRCGFSLASFDLGFAQYRPLVALSTFVILDYIVHNGKARK
jgi:hypothetical protein